LTNKHTYDKAQTTTLIFTGVRQGIKDKCNCDNNGNSRDRERLYKSSRVKTEDKLRD
jgi:hypothetical protein